MRHSLPAIAALAILTAAAAFGATDAPPRQEYVLGPEDQLSIRALHAAEFPDKAVTVSSAGLIQLPLVGQLEAAGKTVEQLEDNIRKRLSEFINEPQVTVSVTEFRSQPVSVLGAVNKPGVYQLRGSRRLLEVLSMAEGPRPEAGYMVQVTRRMENGPLPLPQANPDSSGQVSVAVINLASVARGMDPAGNIFVKPHDVIAVPQGDKVFVMGDVVKPGVFPLTDGKTFSVLEALSMAGGPVRTAAPQRARILRVAPGGKNRSEVAVDVRKILAGQSADLPLQSDDILFIPNSAAKSATLRSLEAVLQTASGMAIWWPR